MMLVYSRPFFRTCEIVCNHAARVLLNPNLLGRADVQDSLADLNRRRVDHQLVLRELGRSHDAVCAECQGRCCHGPRERDAFTDRVLQHPDSPHLGARRRTEAPNNGNACPELTPEGCRLPLEQRPVQCSAYFCGDAVKKLSGEECRAGIRALAGLMKVQIGTVRLAVKSRLSIRQGGASSS